MNKLSVCLQVYNEEERIGQFVRSFIWVDEIIIFNKESTDKTKEIAIAICEKVKVIDVPYDDGSYGLPTWIEKYITTEWVLVLTASDLIDSQLSFMIKKIILSNPKYGLIYLPFKVYSLGVSSKYSPFHTRYKPLLFKKANLVVSSRLHYELTPKEGTLIYKLKSKNNFIHHFTNNNVKGAIDKTYRYCSVEAKQMIDENGKLALVISFYHLVKAIFSGIFRKGVFLGGKKTVILWLLLLNYFITRIILIWDYSNSEDSQSRVNELRKTVN
jgi:(heptosyl)LPS beta-1,4-glucosyltransferase